MGKINKFFIFFSSLFLLFVVFFNQTHGEYEYKENCFGENIYFVEKNIKNEILLSSFLCNFGEIKKFRLKEGLDLKNNKIIKINFKAKNIKLLNNIEQKDFINETKNAVEYVKNNDFYKKLFKSKLESNSNDYNGKFPNFFKKQIFNKKELSDLDKDNHSDFENTYGERLLMDGRIISREEWGANESYGKPEVYMKGCEDGSCFKSKASWAVGTDKLKDNYNKYFLEDDLANRKIKDFPDGRQRKYYYPVDRIIIHHTAGKYAPDKKAGINYMKALQKYHALTNRWGDIGYHYLIDGEGNIYEGNYGGKYVSGAHVYMHNPGSVGISLMSDGYYSKEMLKSLEELIIYLGEEYDLDLTQKTEVRADDLSGMKQGWALIAHKELDSKKPKDPMINMDKLRKEIANKIINNE